MARRDNLTKSTSLYTARRKHQILSAGTVYENDLMTASPNDGFFNNEMVLFNDSIFKYRVRAGENAKKRHTRGGWAANASGNTTWTLESVSAIPITEETKIVNKPDYSSMKDFAYYGSAVELVKATVKDIIMRFPGGLQEYASEDLAPKIKVEGVTYYIISNEYEIDFWSKGDGIDDSLKYLNSAYKKYNKGESTEDLGTPTIQIDSSCPEAIIGSAVIGDFSLYIYKNGNGKYYLLEKEKPSGKIICRPKEEYQKEFWDSLDDFERVLLNRDSTPLYTAVLETPYQTEEGFFYDMKSYTWPTLEEGDKAYSPDITTSKFQGYLNSLLNVAQYHDEHDSDNIWRMMTHESIKNLDWTFMRDKDGNPVDASDIDSSRMKAMLRMYGRLFDDLKRSADNVKASSTISYDGKGNIPDYFLTDELENEGWEAKNVAPTTDSSIKASGYTDANKNVIMKSGKTSSDVNIEFMKRLLLNSNYIQSMKGTRRGIETILGLFGYKKVVESAVTSPGTYAIHEYVRFADNFPNYNEMARLRALGEYIYGDEAVNLMAGYPVSVIRPAEKDDASEDYLIPWMDKNATYKYPLYFQSKGGWGKWKSKGINLSIASAKTLSESGKLRIYSETEPYMRFANDIDGMLQIPNDEVFENMVCYVTDISDLNKGYSASTEDKDKNDYSHYFILKNTSLSPFVGFVNTDSNKCYGWRNVYISEYKVDDESVATEDGKRILYLESLTAEYASNNPHTGKGKYDDGHEYIDRFNYIFSEALKSGNYDYLRKGDKKDCDDYTALATSGFQITTAVTDDKKCHYFSSVSNGKSIIYVSGASSAADESHNELSNPDRWDVNKKIDDREFPRNPAEEKVKSWEDGADYSVMNVKNVLIQFGTSGNTYLRDYIQNTVLKYLEPMIPSTTILSYQFDNEEIMFAAPNPTKKASRRKKKEA